MQSYLNLNFSIVSLLLSHTHSLSTFAASETQRESLMSLTQLARYRLHLLARSGWSIAFLISIYRELLARC